MLEELILFETPLFLTNSNELKFDNRKSHYSKDTEK